MMVVERSARANAMNANQPTMIVSIRRHGEDGFDILPVNREKSVCL